MIWEGNEVVEINWNGGYYREGGTVIYNGQVKTIKRLETDIVRSPFGIFENTHVLKITTEDGQVIESVGR